MLNVNDLGTVGSVRHQIQTMRTSLQGLATFLHEHPEWKESPDSKQSIAELSFEVLALTEPLKDFWSQFSPGS